VSIVFVISPPILSAHLCQTVFFDACLLCSPACFSDFF
jgi:hypothetical protein